MSQLKLNDVDDCGSVTFREPPNQGFRGIRIRIDGSGMSFRDITRDDARRLRDWLDEWLGDGHMGAGYTPQDVERLVQEVRESMQNGNLNNNVHALYNDVLKPFLPPPDPDVELVKKIKAIRDAYWTNTKFGNDKIIEAIREHDAAKP